MIQLLETVASIRIGRRCRRPKCLGLDKGYDSDPHRRALRHRRIIPVAPYRANHVTQPLAVRQKIGSKNGAEVSVGRSNGRLVG